MLVGLTAGRQASRRIMGESQIFKILYGYIIWALILFNITAMLL